MVYIFLIEILMKRRLSNNIFYDRREFKRITYYNKVKICLIVNTQLHVLGTSHSASVLCSRVRLRENKHV